MIDKYEISHSDNIINGFAFMVCVYFNNSTGFWKHYCNSEQECLDFVKGLFEDEFDEELLK